MQIHIHINLKKIFVYVRCALQYCRMAKGRIHLADFLAEYVSFQWPLFGFSLGIFGGKSARMERNAALLLVFVSSHALVFIKLAIPS
jgi:hypothetical protein